MGADGGGVDLGLDGFEVVGELGRGGFGVVYQAVDTVHGRDVAIKVMEGHLDDGVRRRFDRERRAMGRLSGHPAIGVVHTSGFLANGRPYLVMEMLHGGSLGERLENDGPLPLEQVLTMADSLCEALATAHAGGVLHLDLKPDNLLLSSYGRVKIVDFGIAAIIDDAESTSTIRATPGFADPAVLEGHSGTEASDVYGLAVTLYALLNGEGPYGSSSGSGSYSVLRRMALDPVPRLVRADIPVALADLLEHAMAKDPAARPATIDEFRSRLAAVRSTPAASATSSPVGQPSPVAGSGTGHADESGVGQAWWTDTTVAGSPPPPDWALPTHHEAHSSPSNRMRWLVGGVVGAVVLLVGLVIVSGGGSDEPKAAGDRPESSRTSEATSATDASSVPAATAAPAVSAQPVVPVVTDEPVGDGAGLVAFGPRLSDTIDFGAGLPGPEVSVVTGGSPAICLSWGFGGLPVGTTSDFAWSFDGQRIPESAIVLEYDGSQSFFFGCFFNDVTGIASGRYDAEWVVDGQTVFRHGVYVNSFFNEVPVVVENVGASPICAAYYEPTDTNGFGLARNSTVLETNGVLEATLPSGVYGLTVVACDGSLLYDQAQAEVFDAVYLPIG